MIARASRDAGAGRGVALRTYFVETWGCQMNVLDSQRLEGLLQARGLAPADRAEEADVALLNTCSVREKAVQKVLSRLGELRQARAGARHARGSSGCAAASPSRRARGCSPAARRVDFVLGPGRDRRSSARHSTPCRPGTASADRVLGRRATYDSAPDRAGRAARAVRHGRPRLQSALHLLRRAVHPRARGAAGRSPRSSRRCELLADGGAKEVTLLGQTINAYRCPETGADFARPPRVAWAPSTGCGACSS